MANPEHHIEVQEGPQVKPLLLRSSLKKANSFGEQPASPGQLLFCRQDTPRRQAQDALLYLLACNKATQAGLEQDSRLTQQGRAIVLECTEDPFPWRSALGQHSSLLKVIRCRKGFLPEEGLEDICSLLRHGFSRLVIVCGSATCDYLLSCVEEWKCSEQRWRRPKRQHVTPRSSTQQELPLALARRMQKPQGLGRWLSCIIGVPESSCGRPNLNGRVTPDGGRDLSSDSSDSDSSDESEADPFEEREDAYVPAVEAVSAQQHKGHQRRVTMQLEDWEEKPSLDGRPSLRRQISADAYCCSRMQNRKRKDELQPNEATLARIVDRHSVLLSQLLLRKLSKRLDQSVLSGVEVAPMGFSSQTRQLRVIKRSWFSNSCYFHEEGEPKHPPSA